MKYYVTHILFVDIACCVIVVADPKCCLLFVADFTLKRFFFAFLFFCALFNFICGNFRIFAFHTVVAIRLVLHNSGVSSDCTIAENLLLPEKI